MHPDGTAVAVESPAGLTVYAAGGGTPRTYPAASGTPVFWTPGGGSIYVRRSAIPAIVEELDLATGSLRPVRTLLPADPTGVTFIQRVVFAPNGRSFVYSYSRTQIDLYMVDGAK